MQNLNQIPLQKIMTKYFFGVNYFMNHPPPLFLPCSFQATTELMLHGSFIAFVIAGTHQHSYNHAALGSPTRTPKNGKEKK